MSIKSSIRNRASSVVFLLTVLAAFSVDATIGTPVVSTSSKTRVHIIAPDGSNDTTTGSNNNNNIIINSFNATKRRRLLRNPFNYDKVEHPTLSPTNRPTLADITDTTFDNSMTSVPTPHRQSTYPSAIPSDTPTVSSSNVPTTVPTTMVTSFSSYMGSTTLTPTTTRTTIPTDVMTTSLSPSPSSFPTPTKTRTAIPSDVITPSMSPSPSSSPSTKKNDHPTGNTTTISTSNQEDKGSNNDADNDDMDGPITSSVGVLIGAMALLSALAIRIAVHIHQTHRWNVIAGAAATVDTEIEDLFFENRHTTDDLV